MRPSRSHNHQGEIMARRDDALGVTGAETIIGPGVVIEGNLTGQEDMVIDGTVNGEIRTAGDVTLGVNAEVHAPIQATNITIAGTLHGPITAAGEVTIRETGHMYGDITAAGLS